MKSKYILLATVFITVLVFGVFYLHIREERKKPGPVTFTNLTKDEQGMYKLLRDIPGDLVVSEDLVREQNSRVVVTFYLDQSKTNLQSLAYNLTSLAKKKHDLGISDEAFRASLKQ